MNKKLLSAFLVAIISLTIFSISSAAAVAMPGINCMVKYLRRPDR